MAEKLNRYQGRLQGFKNKLRDKYSLWQENKFGDWIQNPVTDLKCEPSTSKSFEDFSHICRKKTRRELLRISAAVMGIELSYAAETAFVSPTLLKIGIEHKHMTLVWALSPLIGFFLTPVLGSLSDRCQLKIGRRRPFIFIMSLGVLLGLILVPNGEWLGYALGDEKPSNNANINYINFKHNYETVKHEVNVSYIQDGISTNSTDFNTFSDNSHPWAVIITIIGTVLLDFDADACQSPARAYLLDITVPGDHARGLSTFTIMAGLGGCFGYALGGINWDVTTLGDILGGHVRAVFTFTTILFVICVSYTITSFKEIPLHILNTDNNYCYNEENVETDFEENGSAAIGDNLLKIKLKTYSAMDERKENANDIYISRKPTTPDLNTSILIYLKSIIYMPNSIKILCLTNLFCWMAHVCYSLYFTDFVGETVFEGSPTATEGSASRKLYESGVRFGCWGMSMYSLSCACYSMKIEMLINKFGAKWVYVGGLLTYSMGMLLMAITRNKFGVIIFSWTAGVMYSTLFTMPYLIIAHYHAKGTFDVSEDGIAIATNQIRGLGTDVAVISSMVFLAQFILSIGLGSIVYATGTTTAIVSVASVLALFGAVLASQIMYLDL